MAVPTGTVQTFAMVGIREDLSDVISNISPTETPMYSMARKGRTGSRSPEWQIDTLQAADPDNKTIEGDDVTGDTMQQPTRVKNYVQLMDKVVIVSTTGQAVDAAGRASELKYQVAKSGQELKRDIEARITQNDASVVGAAGTAGEMAGAESWIETNTSLGATGTVGGFDSGTGLVDAPGDGTQRAADEAQLKEVIRECWTAGGDPSVIMVGGFNKQAFSAFSGIATQYKDNGGRSLSRAVILGAADMYVSDFGEHRIIPNRFQRDRTALVLDPSLWELKFLQPFKTVPLAKTGHSDKRLMSAELTLCCKNEAGNGKVADLNDS
jgi:hypothetical protein